MASTAQLRQWWSAYQCVPTRYGRVSFPGDGRTWSLWVAKPAIEAFQALSVLMGAHGCLFRESAGGTYKCRQIAGSPLYSLHAYAIAIDINPAANPFRTCQTDMPQAFIDDVLSLQTENGKQVFTWGGDWRPCDTADPMHFQIDCSPADLATGIVVDMTPEEYRQIVREELDRRQDGKPGPVNGFVGTGQAVVSTQIGATGPNGQPPAWNVGLYLRRTYDRINLAIVQGADVEEQVEAALELLGELPADVVDLIKERL